MHMNDGRCRERLSTTTASHRRKKRERGQQGDHAPKKISVVPRGAKRRASDNSVVWISV